jgi:hypothetical protein
MAEFAWDVHLPGEDLPRRFRTDYLLSEGDEIDVDGRPWVVEAVEMIDDAGDPASGVVVVAPLHDPELAPPS